MKNSIFSCLIAMVIAVSTFAQQKPQAQVKSTPDTVAMFFDVKKQEAVNDMCTQLQQEGGTVVLEAGYFVEGKNGELIPVPEADAESKHAKLIAMNWGDLPEVNDSTVTENRIRGIIVNDHPLFWPINGNGEKYGWQVEVIVIRKGNGKSGPKPVDAFMDLKKAMPNQLKDGTTYQVFVSDTVKTSGKACENKTAYYYSAYEKNFSVDNNSDKTLLDCKKVVPVMVHLVKIKKGRLVEPSGKPNERGTKYVVTAWGINTLDKSGSKKPRQRAQYYLPTANNK